MGTQPAIGKKVCLLGAFAVGKTSLVRRYVESMFDERYQTTLGVKIDKKTVVIDGTGVTLVLWDFAGKDQFSEVRASHLRGASGYILVVDGTRPGTLETAAGLRDHVRANVGGAPGVIALNKSDLQEQWALSEGAADAIFPDGDAVYRTSARSGAGVEELFAGLARRMLKKSP